MGFKPIFLAVNGNGKGVPIVASSEVIFSWGAEHIGRNQFQTAYNIRLARKNTIVWESSWNKTEEQRCVYTGPTLLSGGRYVWTLQIKDKEGNLSESVSAHFICAKQEPWTATWIKASNHPRSAVRYFRKEFQVRADLIEACLFVCGIGLHEVWLNGEKQDQAVLQPAHSNYSKHCYYVTLPIEPHILSEKENCLGIILADGWRRNYGPTINEKRLKREISFFGEPQLIAELLLRYSNGTVETVPTDTSWCVGEGAIRSSHLFDGERYDASYQNRWNLCGFSVEQYDFSPAMEAGTKIGVLKPQIIPPILEHKRYTPISKHFLTPTSVIFDFGVNLSGYAAVQLLENVPKGSELKLLYSELLDENGDSMTATQRGAASEDVLYTGEYGLGVKEWTPSFTYHGFRYIRLTASEDVVTKIQICAIQIHSNIDKFSDFRSGSAILDRIYQMCYQTELDNVHSIATDCPQRDERMGWLNDATVRFESMPYFFQIAPFFHKILGDIQAEQHESGAITDTAPYVLGNFPADPVCSSFLIAAEQAYLHEGSMESIRQYYKAFQAWDSFLKENSTNGIVNLANFGDWASPSDCCGEGDDLECVSRLPITEGIDLEKRRSRVTPGLLLSTGYRYLNCRLLKRFAELLYNKEDVAYYSSEMTMVQKAFLNKWWNQKTGIVGTGSQGCQAFALWLEIIPVEYRALVAERLHDAVVEVGNRITTGNLTTRYLLETLSKYGYVEDAWKLITRESYPSLGYMIQNGATTVWERFELKKESHMNSHNHPMYASVLKWYYQYMAGLAPIEAGWKVFSVSPVYPNSLSYVQASVETAYGTVEVKWEKRYGKMILTVNVPFGTEANVVANGSLKCVGSGFHVFSWNYCES